MAWMRGIESKGQLSTMIFHPSAHRSLQNAVDAWIGGCKGKLPRSSDEARAALPRIEQDTSYRRIAQRSRATVLVPIFGGADRLEGLCPRHAAGAPPACNVVFVLVAGIAGQLVTSALAALFHGLLTSLLVAPVGGALAAGIFIV
jgi:hypothetical protein